MKECLKVNLGAQSFQGLTFSKQDILLLNPSIPRIARIGHAGGDILGEEPTCEVGTQLREAGPRMLAIGLAQSLAKMRTTGRTIRGAKVP